jgi:hypothetical protein
VLQAGHCPECAEHRYWAADTPGRRRGKGSSREMSAKSAWRGLTLTLGVAAVLVLVLGVLPVGAAEGPGGDSIPSRAPHVPVSSGGHVSQGGSQVIAYAIDSDATDSLWSIVLNTGVATRIGFTGFSDIESLSFSAAGLLYGVDEGTKQLVTCGLSSGHCTAVGSLMLDYFEDTGLTFDASGGLWMSTDEPPPFYFYRLNPATGRATQVGAMGQEVTGLTFGNGVLYGLGGDYRDNLVIVDRATGSVTSVGPLGAVTLIDGGIDFDSKGVLWGISDPEDTTDTVPSQVFTINTSTGAATVVATVTNSSDGRPLPGFESLAVRPSGVIPPEEEPFVPEPGTLVLLASGLLGLSGYSALRWRKRE